MTPKPVWYITTPIYYVNGKPHVGSALTTVCCDFLARYHRMRGDRTWFLTGIDENATKVYEAAAKAGVPAQEYVDGLAAEFRGAWQDLHVSCDDFIRTTEPRHVEVVQEVFRRLKATGDIYSGLYEGWYCVSDETFFRDSDIEDDHLCPNAECRKPLRRVQEENYFFRLSAYGDRLLAHIEANPGFLQPEFRRNEVVSFIQQGLRDMSVTRSNDGWGITVPDEPGKVIYVWFDALINYLSATGWPHDMERHQELWPADAHMMAKEIFVRFHATLWPAMLMALDLPLPRSVYAHGWWVDAGGKKEGKRTGGLPHPRDLAAEIAALSGASEPVSRDAVRYLLLREMVFHGDTEFSTDNFLNRYNTDLANDLGNLCNRAANMVTRYFEGVVPAASAPDAEIAALAAEVVADYERALGDYRFNAALEAAWRLIARMNRYIEEKTPWSLAKKGLTDELGVVLYTCMEAIRLAATLLRPVMPEAACTVLRQVGADPDAQGAWQDATRWGGLAAGVVVPAPQPIFPRLDLTRRVADEAASTPNPETVEAKKTVTEEPKPAAPASPQPAAPEKPATIQYDDFAKVELRIGTVEAAEAVPNASKLLKLTVQLGEEQRTILAGIAEMYQPDELVGRQVVVVANLAPRKMRGIESQGMLLAAECEGQAILLQPETVVPSGSKVR